MMNVGSQVPSVINSASTFSSNNIFPALNICCCCSSCRPIRHRMTMFSLLRKFMHQPYKMFNNIVSKFGIHVTENLRVLMQSQGEICVL